MTETIADNENWFNRIHLETQENEDGSLTLTFSWDENDAALRLWSELGDEKREELILNALKLGTKTNDLEDKEPGSEE